MFDGFDQWSSSPPAGPAVRGLDVLEACGRGQAGRRTAAVLAGILTAVAGGDKPSYRSYFDDDAVIDVVGLDRSRIGGVGPGESVTEVLFPDGFEIVVVRAAVCDDVGFAEVAIKGRVRTTGRLYVTPAVISVQCRPRGLVSRYSEYTQVERLYAASAPDPD
ncbi:hypothetical protein [Mycolicibacterium thermoresistibile]|uniref:SnoaL-like domain-containing protein n=2 Tax=Mycolicibacterium thermoresistibile TaxID=1797 RepID=G7CJ92_MYCT3|nr:hypothetical protein [Mycolicibacterium thermoresistibile]EHI12690.1 hypothetical protein KEK_17363 [Mycolicibacterium thermoresistibile ATCC 19527]MCV7190049.1 hypothetical protein [Mycolicibacterium thermoresistibile]GAT13894.1 putative uncharacterized protein [Mycolicibacterium thermoresistibile]SNW19067.1 Uncharacterised protein [Mycolicibacterium thermoresistibile]